MQGGTNSSRGNAIAVALPSLILYLAVTTVLLLAVLWLQNGQFTYTLDDPYIHMSVARNVITHGVWGATKDQPSSCSSSPLWESILILCDRLLGVYQFTPLILNILFGGLFVVFLGSCLLRFGIKPQRVKVLLFLFVVIGYLHANVFTGMEHTLQCLLDLAFLVYAAEFLSHPPTTLYSAWRLILLAPLVSSIRYEGVFLVAIVCALALLRRAFVPAIVIGIMAWLPLIVYGLAMMHLGSAFFPYSVVLKAKFDFWFANGLKGYFGPRFLIHVMLAPELAALLLALIVTLRAQWKRGLSIWSQASIVMLIVLPCILIHLEFASTRAPFRYHAYLVVLAVFALSVSSGPLFEEGLSILRSRRRAAKLLIAIPLSRGVIMAVTIPNAALNIYDQQFQMAKFCDAYYRGQTVALNDIGAVSYFADVKILDCWGLGTPAVGNARIDGTFDFNRMKQLASERSAKVAILYDQWFREYTGFPGDWSSVGQWEIPVNLVCGGPTVDVYAIDPGEKTALLHHLKDFASSLPKSVKQTGLYLGESILPVGTPVSCGTRTVGGKSDTESKG